jgi:hypothetical protein
MNCEGGKTMPRRMHSVLLTLWMFAIFSFVFGGRAAAQSGAAEITGTVADSTGAVVPKATVTITNEATGAKTVLTTTVAGLYYARLNPGAYRIEVEREGFRSLTVTNVPVEAGRSVRQDITLEVGTVRQAVQVSASAATAALDRDTSTVNIGIPEKVIATLPVATRRVFEELNVVPGVVWTSSGLGREGGTYRFTSLS